MPVFHQRRPHRACAVSISGGKRRAYLDTTDLPVQSNATGVQFRGSEITLYGLGGGDGLTNLTDLDGSIGLGAGALPLADTANGFTGIAWIYERVGLSTAGSAVSEKLFLVDANDGGDSDLDGNTPLDWTILAVYDLAGMPSGWVDLAVSIDATGNGIASFNGSITSFSTPALHSGAFNIGYRENLQLGADGTPDALLRPATFTFAGLGLLSLAPPAAGAIQLTMPAWPGQNIGLEYSTSLALGSWVDIGSFTVTGLRAAFADTNPVRVANSRGFYRGFPR